jgi:cytochrome P450
LDNVSLPACHLPFEPIGTLSPSTSGIEDKLPDSVFEFCRAPHSFLLNLALTQGPNARFQLNNETFAVLGDPNAIHAVFNGSVEDFEKGELYDIIEAGFGQSVFTVDGPQWTEFHEVLTPLFSRSRIDAMAPVVRSVVERHIEQWTRLIETGKPIELLTSTKRLAFDVVAVGLIGIENETARDRLFAVLHRADRIEAVRLKYLGKRVPAIRSHFRRNPLAEEIDRVALAIAHERIEGASRTSEPKGDLIGGALSSPLFLGVSEERKPRLVRDLVSSMLTAGYVTTGESLFWSLCLLARTPAAQERAQREIGASSSAWVSAVISESLRLYPPAWFLGRIARRPVELGGMRFDAGTRLICSPYVLHRMPTLWPAPDEFRPERFLPGTAIVPRSYIPFGTGMRGCIGRALAMMELSTLVPAVVSRFRLRLADENPVTLAGTFSMQPREAVHIWMTPR